MQSPPESLAVSARPALFDYLSRLVPGNTAGADAVLLEHFVRSRDEQAFAALVARHGPMVRRVCRRVLADPHAADDAFQATFLVLARRAAVVRPRQAVAAWLHGVAHRVALRARAGLLRRQARERPSADLDPPEGRPDPLAELSARELLSVLDEEVRRLPEAQRLVVILCCLEGHTQEEVAARLGWTAGSVKGRLERGRRLLHARLARRGLALSTILAAAEVARGMAAVPVRLGEATVTAALAFIVDGATPVRLAVLAEAGLAGVGAGGLKAAAGALVLLAGVLAVAAGTLLGPASDEKKEQAGPDRPPRVDRHGDPLPPGAVARLGTTRLRSTARALALTPDGRTLLTASGGRTIGRWDPATGKLRDEVHLAGPFADRSWFSADGRALAVGVDRKLEVWDTATGRRRWLFDAEALHAAFAPDGGSLAVADHKDKEYRIRVLDLATGKDRLLAPLLSYANDLAFDPEGKRLFAAVDNHSLRCWDVASGRQLWQNDHWASTLAISPDGRTLGTHAYQLGPLHLWDARTGKHLDRLGQEGAWGARLLFAPDGRTLAQATGAVVLLWDVEGRKLRHRLDATGPQVAFSADGRSLFALGELLLRWDVTTGKMLYADTRRDGHVGGVCAVAFAPDGRSLASSGADRTVRVWALAGATHRVLRTDGPPGRFWQIGGRDAVHVPGSVPLQFTPDGRRLLSGVTPGTLALTDVSSGKEVRGFALAKPADGWTVAATARLSDDGRTLWVLGETHREPRGSINLDPQEQVRAWDVGSGREAHTSAVNCSSGNDAVFSPDGRLLALPMPVRLRELRTGAERKLAEPGAAGPPFAFSPDGRLLAAAEPDRFEGPAGSLRVYEVLTGRPLCRVKAPLGYGRPPEFSPDGRLLVAAGTDALHAWECDTGRRLLRLEARGRLTHWTPAGFAACLAVAPDGKTVATGHDDGTILVWDLAPAREKLAALAGPVDAAACWDDLAADDPVKAYAAIGRLAAAPEKALALLRDKLRPETVDPRWLVGRLADLDSKSFAAREAATRDLERVAEAVESDLSDELKRTKSPEVRRRLGEVLRTLDRAADVPTAVVRQLRAVVVLERIGSEEARAHLRELAAGAAGARLTRDANAALRRLK